MSRGKKIYFGLLLIITFLVSTMYFSYAFFTSKNEESGKLNIVAGTLKYKITGDDLENNQIEITPNTTRNIVLTVKSINEVSSKYELYYIVDGSNNGVEVGYDTSTKDKPKGTIAKDESKEIEVIIKNNSSVKTVITFGVHGGLANLAYDDITDIGNSLNVIQTSDVILAWNYIGSGEKPSTFPTKDSGYYVDSVSCTNAKGSWDNSSWKLEVENLSGTTATCTLTFGDSYKELILNGTDPVLTDNLIPVLIADNGTVTKAGLNQEWYSYTNQRWANAVVLKDTTLSYNVGDTIPESNIESYFVWIPRYKYKLFNLGNYSSLSSFGSSAQTIDIVFENKNTAVSSGTTVGSYLTHPAFTAFDSNGFWVGKFEVGYNGATSTAGAQVSSGSTSDIIIKPNVYSWRYLTVGSMFKLGYDYLRSDESHMMKNTEWGAVAYLHHSIYGSNTSLRINNNSSYITGYAATEEPTKGYNNGTSVAGNRVESTALGKDGTYTVNYLNASSVVASTTGNITGIYDMSGGAHEYVAGYTTRALTVGGSSGITSIYSDFFTNSSWEKYYDKYSSTDHTYYNKRILGDATGEMGPFGSQTDPDGTARYKSSWYRNFAHFINQGNCWFHRGGSWYYGETSGAFAFNHSAGSVSANFSFRIILTPSS